MQRLKGGSDMDLMSLFDGDRGPAGAAVFSVNRIGLATRVSTASSDDEEEGVRESRAAKELHMRLAQVNARKFLLEADQRMTSEEQLEDAAAAASAVEGLKKRRKANVGGLVGRESKRVLEEEQEQAPANAEAFMPLYEDSIAGCRTVWIPRNVKVQEKATEESSLQWNAVEHRECKHGREKDPSEVYGDGLLAMRRSEIEKIKERDAKGKYERMEKFIADDDFDRHSLEDAIISSRRRLCRFENASKREGVEMFLMMGEKVVPGINAVGARKLSSSASARDEEDEEEEFFSCSDEEDGGGSDQGEQQELE